VEQCRYSSRITTQNSVITSNIQWFKKSLLHTLFTKRHLLLVFLTADLSDFPNDVVHRNIGMAIEVEASTTNGRW
jgi:hypothetical protein